MAPKKFHYFPKLPTELQLRIWVLAMEPRLIRAKWAAIIKETEYKTIYHLSCGPVPKIILVNKQSREEALKYYTLVKSRASLLRQPGAQVMGTENKDKEPKIYVNYDIDTIYFVNFPDTNTFISWMRRIPKQEMMAIKATKAIKAIKAIKVVTGVEDVQEVEDIKEVKDTKDVKEGKEDMSQKMMKHTNEKKDDAKPRKMVKHIAFSIDVVTRFSTSMAKFDALYGAVMDNPTLKTITVVLDMSEFHQSGKPHTYGFKAPTLAPPKKKQQDDEEGFDRNVQSLAGTQAADPFGLQTGGLGPVASQWRLKTSFLERIVKDIWENPDVYGADQAKKFKAWKDSEAGKKLAPPVFEFKKIAINPKKHVKGQ